MSRGTIGAGLALALLVAHPAFSQQDEPSNRYEMLYGTPVDVSLSDLVQNPMAYSNRAVRTTGRLEMSPSVQSRRTYMLVDSAVDIALLQPVPEIGAEFESDAMQFLGRQTQITGLVQELSGGLGNPNQPRIAITFWQFMGPPEEVKGPLKFVDVSLESLVSRPGREDGKTVRVVGKFRGRNLYGDLPARSERASGDWVIKDDLYAVWVSGRKPKGSGWELDANLKRDTGKWIEVIGKPETRNGVTYVRAAQVRITDPPRPTADAAPPPPRPSGRRSRPWWSSRFLWTVKAKSPRTAGSSSSSTRTWTRAPSRTTCGCATPGPRCPGTASSTASSSPTTRGGAPSPWTRATCSGRGGRSS